MSRLKRSLIKATLLSPVVVKQDRQSQRSEGLSYLPGSLLRGAVAQTWLQYHGQPDDAFSQLFLDEESCRFGPLDPAPATLPLSAVSCKREAGFRADGKHGMADQLWLCVAHALKGSGDHHRQCRMLDCQADLKNVGGFWNPRTSQLARKSRRQLAVHVGIDRHTHTAADAIFYSLDALAPRADNEDPNSLDGMLEGVMEATPETQKTLQDLLGVVGGEVRAGHARTRGYGRVQLELTDEAPPSSTNRDAWSRALLDYLKQLPGSIAGLDPSQAFFFSLSLPTGAILVDELLRYTLDPAAMVNWLDLLPKPDATARTLAHSTKPCLGGRLWCISAITRHERIRGWNAAHGLPRQDEWAVSRGAVYAYLFQGDDVARKELQSALDGLEEQGIGARRNEGFGRVIVSDEFHRLFSKQE